jgi:uncharacterized protein (DUF169 family)
MNKYSTASKLLTETLPLSHSPIAIKIAEEETEIPENCFRPYRDKKERYAFCQIVTMVKENHITVALGKEDHWCWKPLIGLGLVDIEPGSEAYRIALKNNGVKETELSAENFNEFPRLPRKDSRVILVGPLDSCEFEPDVVLIYCDEVSQLRWLIGALKYRSGKRVSTELDYIDSCMWSILPTYISKQPRVTLPDPGEEDRAGCGKNEIILSVTPEMKLDAQKRRLRNDDGTTKMNAKMVPNFPRPQFYNKLFALWGLESNGVVAWSEKERE